MKFEEITNCKKKLGKTLYIKYLESVIKIQLKQEERLNKIIKNLGVSLK